MKLSYSELSLMLNLVFQQKILRCRLLSYLYLIILFFICLFLVYNKTVFGSKFLAITLQLISQILLSISIVFKTIEFLGNSQLYAADLVRGMKISVSYEEARIAYIFSSRGFLLSNEREGSVFMFDSTEKPINSELFSIISQSHLLIIQELTNSITIALPIILFGPLLDCSLGKVKLIRQKNPLSLDLPESWKSIQATINFISKYSLTDKPTLYKAYEHGIISFFRSEGFIVRSVTAPFGWELEKNGVTISVTE